MDTKVMCKLSHGTWSSSLLKDLNSLRESGLMCDVKILLGAGIQTLAHSCVLSAASSFFRTLLIQIDHPEIDMSSFPGEVILQVLNFIYTGEATFSYSDLNSAHRIALLLNMTVLDLLLQNMLKLDKTGAEESAVVTVADVSDVNPQAVLLNPVDDIKAITPSNQQLVDTNQCKDDISYLETQLIQEPQSSLLQPSISAMDVKGIISPELKHDQEPFHESSSKYNELHTVQLQHVLNDIGDITQLAAKQDGEIGSHKIRRHPPRERPVKVLNKEVPADGSVPDRAAQTLPDELSLGTSVLCPSEVGVFSKTSLPRGSTFGPYEGKIITDDGVISHIPPRYCWTIYKSCKLLHWLDGHDKSKANWMRYVQATADSDANLKAFQHEGKLYFEVFRRITATEELLVSDTYIGYRGNIYKEDKCDQGEADTSKEENGKKTIINTESEGNVSDKTEKSSDVNTGEKEDAVGFPCEECDVIFLVKDMYHKHMHTVHGKPLPLHVYLSAQEDHAKQLQIENFAKQFPVNNDDVEQDIQDVAVKNEGSKTSCVEVGQSPRGEVSPISESSCHLKVDGEHFVRRSHRARRQSRRLQDFHVSDLGIGGSMDLSDVKNTSLLGAAVSDESCVEKQRNVEDPGKKSHVCHICQKAFKLEMSLKRHLRLHSANVEDKITCEHCGKLFTHVGNLNVHMRIHTGEKPFTCDICGRGFSQNGNKELHLSRHRKENLYICDLCGKSYNDCSYLKKHIRIQHGCPRSVPCPKCGKSFSDKAALRRHAITHTDKKLYKCTVCGKSFNQYSNLRSHKRVHTSEKPHRCPDCGLCFRTKHELRVHTIFHTGIKQYQCEVCLKRFRYLASSKKHQCSGCRVQFENDDGGPYACRLCQQTLDSAEYLLQHITGHFYECTECRKVFTEESFLVNHQKKHGNFKPFVCRTCGRCYADETSLKTHARLHNAKQHRCPVCQKSWPTASILRFHMLMHTGEKPHQCTVCNMHFRMKHQLKRHMQTHNKHDGSVKTPEQPRPICPTCGKSFFDKQALKKHEFLHTGIKPFACKICNKTFTTRGTMKTHLTGHLGERRFKCTLCQKAYRANKDYQNHLATHAAPQEGTYQCTYCEKSFPYKKSLRLHMKTHTVLDH